MTKIYLSDIRNGVDEELCRVAFPERYEKARRNASPEAGLRSMGAGVLLYRVLGLREADILCGEKGKPCCRDGHIRFNLSHSGNYCALAVSDREVGVDVEKQNPKHLKVSNRVFLPEEEAYMREEPLFRFFTLWTLKESVSKTLGMGFSLGFRSFSVLPLLRGETITVEGRILSGKGMWMEDHALSVCTEGEKTEAEIEII